MIAETKTSFVRFNFDDIPKCEVESSPRSGIYRNVTMNEARTISLRYKHGNPDGRWSFLWQRFEDKNMTKSVQTPCHFQKLPRNNFKAKSKSPIRLKRTTKLLASSTNYSLPTLLQSQTRHKPPAKALSQCEKKVSVDMITPFRIMSYKNEVKEDTDTKCPTKALPCGRRGKAAKNQATAAATSTRWKTKPNPLPNQNQYPDPLMRASKPFMSRISELSLLQTETVKYEKTKKVKKKKSPDV